MLILARLYPQCRVLPADLRVRIAESDVSTYPDLTVVCGPLIRAREDPLAIINPSVVVEVTSASTEGYDRGAKLTYYKQLASVQVVLIVSHREPRITIVQRDRDGWTTLEARGGAAATIGDVSFEVNELYRALDGLT